MGIAYTKFEACKRDELQGRVEGERALRNINGTVLYAEYRAESEVWKMELAGGAGELGAARGEALTYHHELQLRRDDAGEAIPVR